MLLLAVPAWAAEAPAEPHFAPEEDPSDFDVGDVEVKLRVGFDGYGYGPLSLLGAFVGWLELQGNADLGLIQKGDVTWGIGVEAYYARPFLLEVLGAAVVGATTGQRLRWRLTEWGIMARGTVHYTGFSSFDPYAVVYLGPTYSLLNIRVRTPELTATGTFRSAGMRVGAGAGATVVTKFGWLAGAELRYQAGFRFRYVKTVDVRDTNGDLVDVFEASGNQRSPRGFSWMFYVGYRW